MKQHFYYKNGGQYYMNRVTLNIDLDTNKIFEETLDAAIKSRSREIARNSVETELSKLIEEKITEVVGTCLERIKGDRWYKQYSEIIQKNIESQLIQIIYEDVGKNVITSIKGKLENALK